MSMLCHFELPAESPEKLIEFYQKLFPEWKIEKFDCDCPGGYWAISLPQTSNKICGALMKKQNPEHGVTIYFEVNSVDQFAKKVQELGGKIVMPKTTVPKMGYFIVCLDPANNPLGLWENDENAA